MDFYTNSSTPRSVSQQQLLQNAWLSLQATTAGACERCGVRVCVCVWYVIVGITISLRKMRLWGWLASLCFYRALAHGTAWECKGAQITSSVLVRQLPRPGCRNRPPVKWAESVLRKLSRMMYRGTCAYSQTIYECTCSVWRRKKCSKTLRIGAPSWTRRMNEALPCPTPLIPAPHWQTSRKRMWIPAQAHSKNECLLVWSQKG